VPAVYLGYERVAPDFFMHRVRSENGAESSLAGYAVFRREVGPDGERWVPLESEPRRMAHLTSLI
jgi:hypothetical protein